MTKSTITSRYTLRRQYKFSLKYTTISTRCLVYPSRSKQRGTNLLLGGRKSLYKILVEGEFVIVGLIIASSWPFRRTMASTKLYNCSFLRFEVTKTTLERPNRPMISYLFKFIKNSV